MNLIDRYKDDSYLDNYDKEVINYLYNVKERFNIDINKNTTKYKDNIEAYDEYINFIAYLIKCMSLPNNIISASIILSIITKMGVFSDNYKLFTNEKIQDDLYGFLGINIVKGYAVCRHFASFQSDVLKKLGYMCEPFYCYMSNRDIIDADKKLANHAINLIEYNNSLYGFDSYNNGLFSFVDNKKMKEMFVVDSHYIYYKPYINIMYNNETISSINNMIELFNNIKDKPDFDIREYKYIREMSEKMVLNNKGLLNDFHESSKKYIKRITDGLK